VTEAESPEERKQLDWIRKIRRINDEVLSERLHQFAKWGYQRHSGTEWLAILAEEFGEAAKGSVDLFLGHPGDPELRKALRAELIQTAAVAVAFVQAMDTGES